MSNKNNAFSFNLIPWQKFLKELRINWQCFFSSQVYTKSFSSQVYTKSFKAYDITVAEARVEQLPILWWLRFLEKYKCGDKQIQKKIWHNNLHDSV